MSAELWLGIVLSTLIALVAYFFNKWLALLEKDLEQAQKSVDFVKNDVKNFRAEFHTLRSEIKEEIKNHPQIKLLGEKMSSLDNVRDFFKTEAIPQMRESKEAYGRIVHLEAKTVELDGQFKKIIQGLEALRLRK